MATTFTADNYTDPVPDIAQACVSLRREFKYSVAAAFVINDIVKLGRLRGAGSEIVLTNYYIDVPDLDSGTAIKFDLGDNEVDDRYVAASTVGQAVGKLTPAVNGVAGAIPKKIAVNTDLALHVDTAPTTGLFTVVILGWYDFHYTGIATLLS